MIRRVWVLMVKIRWPDLGLVVIDVLLAGGNVYLAHVGYGI